jgi:hypothetical protein
MTFDACKYILHGSMDYNNSECFSECEQFLHAKFINWDISVLQALCMNKAGKMHSMYKITAHCFMINPLN